MVRNDPIQSMPCVPSLRTPAPAPAPVPPPEVAAEQPAVTRQRTASNGNLLAHEQVQFRLQARKVELGDLRERTAERRAMLQKIQQELDQLSSPQDYLDNYEEIERLECLRASLEKEQESDLCLVRDALHNFGGPAMTTMRVMRGGFWTRLLSGSPCRSEEPQPESPW